MIEVIKHGKTQKSGTIITKCPECECVFKFDFKKDVIHSYFLAITMLNAQIAVKELLSIRQKS